MYEYRALVTKVVDGDTVHCRVDLGFDVGVNVTLRLAGINSPEMKTAEGVAARDALRSFIENAHVTVKTTKDRKEKFGRYLARIYSEAGLDINEAMIAGGHAVEYK